MILFWIWVSLLVLVIALSGYEWWAKSKDQTGALGALPMDVAMLITCFTAVVLAVTIGIYVL